MVVRNESRLNSLTVCLTSLWQKIITCTWLVDNVFYNLHYLYSDCKQPWVERGKNYVWEKNSPFYLLEKQVWHYKKKSDIIRRQLSTAHTFLKRHGTTKMLKTNQQLADPKGAVLRMSDDFFGWLKWIEGQVQRNKRMFEMNLVLELSQKAPWEEMDTEGNF